MSLLEFLGIDENSPEMIAASNNLDEIERLIISLKEARVAAGLTQADVAEILKTKQPVISDLESFLGNPSLLRVMEYAHAVGQRVRLQAHPIGEPWVPVIDLPKLVLESTPYSQHLSSGQSLWFDAVKIEVPLESA